MRELYIEGPATHDGPKSCGGAREDADEALTGVRAGWAIEPRNAQNRGADPLTVWGRPHRGRRYCEPPPDPARSEEPSMRGISTRENREIPGSLVRLITARAVQGRPRPQA